MDLALKQRLVGAVVLVVLGVIFIPMLLDGSADRQGEGARIPEPPEGRIETRKLPLQPGLEEETPEAEPIVVERNTDPGSVTSLPQPTPAPTEQERPSQRSDDVVSRPEDPQPVAASGWGLQLGMFGKMDNARSLVRRLGDAGFEAYSEPVAVSGRTLQRVRMGPWPSRDAAADAADRLGREFPDIEISLQLIDAAGAATPEPTETASGWMVQVGSFSEQDNAEALRDELREAGFVAHSDRIDVDGVVRYRVRVGPEIRRADAEALQDRLRQDMNLNGLVVSHP
ncbi:MAG: SPOR domain-containing protein [Xanthomonadales bacterium]|nr:SPOR domain-containing protein [Xanthomonadales bacterium]